MFQRHQIFFAAVCLMGLQAYAQSEVLSLHVRNSTNEKWYLANYSAKESGYYQPRGGISIEPRDLRTWKIEFHNLPAQWPNSSQKTLIGHLELSRSLGKKHQVYNTADIFIISDAGKERAWICESFSRGLECRISRTKTGKTIDLVIGKH